MRSIRATLQNLRTLAAAWLGNADLREVLRATSWTTAFKVAGVGVAFASNLIMALLYGAEAIGILALASTATSVALLLAKFGTDISVVRLVAAARVSGGRRAVQRVYRRVMGLVVPTGVLAGIAVFATAPFIAIEVFDQPLLIVALQALAITLPFSAMEAVSRASLRGIKSIRLWSALPTTMAPALLLGSLLGITYFVVRDPLTPVYASGTAVIIGSLITVGLWRRSMHRLPVEPPAQAGTTHEAPPAPSARASSLRGIVALSAPMFLTSSMHFVMEWTDTFMLGLYMETADVGVYRILMKVLSVSAFMLFGVNSIIMPKFAEMHARGDAEGVRRLVQVSARLALGLSAPILLVLLVFPEALLGIFGDEFRPGAAALVVLAVGQCFNIACGSTGPLLNMTGHQQVLQYIMSAVAVLNIVLNVVLIQAYGLLGAAIATATSTIVLNLAASIAIRRIFKYWIFARPTLRPVILPSS